MPIHLTDLLPLEGLKIVLVLFLSFLIGLEREERAGAQGPEGYSFGGVRTFPLVGLIGYAMEFLSGGQLMPVTVGFAVVGAFLWLSYKHKLERHEFAGATTEVSGLTVYVIGALVARGEFWIGAALGIISLLLLELKILLEGLSRRLTAEEVLTFTKFLLLTAVILPILPNRTVGPFGLNPFHTWLIVVAASGISYGGYLLQQLAKGEGGILLSAVLGALYSSTVTTVVLAKRARCESAPRLYAGGILMAAGMMYLRLLVLVGLFNRSLMTRLSLPFLILGGASLLGGWMWSRLPDAAGKPGAADLQPQNPLELSAAFLFALLFVALLAATHYAIVYFGHAGVYGLSVLSGITDIDPFVLGMTQSAGTTTPLGLAFGGIVVAAASNNLVKGFYAFSFADRKTGIQALGLLASLTVLGLLPLLFNFN